MNNEKLTDKKTIYSSEYQPKKDKIVLSLLVGSFFSFNLMFFAPFDFYLSNWRELFIPTKHIICALVPATLIIFAMVSVICLVTKQRYHIIAVSLFFGIGVAMYIQCNFLSITMGELDGVSHYPKITELIINTFIWLDIIAVPVLIYKIRRHVFKKLLICVSFIVLLLEAVTISVTFISLMVSEDDSEFAGLAGDPQIYSVSTQDEFTYSSNKNYIIIITDEYDSFSFDAAVEAEPDCVSGFGGFTYYTNTLGMYTGTAMAVPFILTGEYEKRLTYDNTLLFDTIKENYKTDFYVSKDLFAHSMLLEYADNYVQTDTLFSDYTRVGLVFSKISLYRCLPEVFKAPFWMYSEDIIYSISGVNSYNYDDLDFYNNCLDAECNTTDKQCFKLIYLNGLHAPLNISADIAKQKDGSVSADEQAIAMNKILSAYFDLLRENGVYENSEIVLLADHGIKTHDDGKYPLLMIKRAGDTGEGITVSNAPISHVDLYPTLLYLAGYGADEDTVFDIKEDEERERYFAASGEYITGSIK